MRFLAHLLPAAIEGIVLFLVLFSAWPFGSVHKYFQWILLVGVGALLVLWAARAVLERRVLWVACPIVVGLAVLCLLGMLQILPLDASWIGWLSPETARLQEFLLPSPQELAAAGLEGADTSVRTLSFDAGATRACLLQLVAILALFAVVRNNLRDPGCFYRLAWLCVANGVLLALVGMGQLASSPPNVVLWSFHTDGAVFGPFICRNHFAYYANLCLGLAAGLLLGTRYFLTAPHGAGRNHENAASNWRDMLRDPRVLWLVACLAMLFAGLLACLSRGGVFGLIAGCGVAVALMLTRSARPRWAASAGVIALAILLVGWIGFDRVSRRWENLVADVAVEGRSTVWLRTLSLVGRFPIAGTGLGTFGLAEPQTRVPGDPANIVWDHAHNDFLELWVEGGILQLLAGLVVIALVIRQGAGAFLRHSNNAMGRLALGALAGFIAVTVQSFVDFGLHVPAVAVLAAVVAALLANLAAVPAPMAMAISPFPPPPANKAPALRIQFAALLQAGALVAVALFLMSEGRRAEQAERYRLAAWRSLDERQLDYLRAAVALAPENAELHLALTDALVHHAEQTAQHSQILTALVPPCATGWPGAVVPLAVTERTPPLLLQHASEIRTARLHAVLAQQRSPLSAGAHERLLKLVARNRKDPTRAIERLLRLSPGDPAVWYAAGRFALRRGDRLEGFRCWHNALLAGGSYLKEIAEAVPVVLSSAELRENVRPPNPQLMVAAADALMERGLNAAEEVRFLRAALTLVNDRGEETTAEDCLLQARIHARLDEIGPAQTAYQAALARNPRSAAWRFEFSEFLHRAGHYAEARQELSLLLIQEPTHSAARSLKKRVDRDFAEHQ